MTEIASINVEQLVTATDRLLVIGLPAKRRPSAPRLELAQPAEQATVLVRPTESVLPFVARVAALGCALGFTVGTLCAAVAAL